MSLIVLAAAVVGGCGPQRDAPQASASGAPTDDGAATVAPASEAELAVSGGGPPPAGNRAEIVRIVDGDTLVARLAGGEERVRLIGIDTPESVAPDRPVECFGPESAARLGELLPPGAPVELVRDAEARDDYGRLLAYVFRSPDELFVNLAMVAEGYAGVLSIAPNTTFADDFDRAAAAARTSRLGLWAACPDPDALFGSVTRR